MTQTPQLCPLTPSATSSEMQSWLQQALQLFGITAEPLQGAKDEQGADLHELLAALLPSRRLELATEPFDPFKVTRENDYFASIWQRLFTIARQTEDNASLQAPQQHWVNFDQGLLEVRFNYQDQSFCYPYNLNNFDLAQDLNTFCFQHLDEHLYGCSNDEEKQVFVLLPEALIEQLRAYRNPHWWRVR